MKYLYIIVTESGIIKTASNSIERAIKKIGGEIEEYNGNSVDVDDVSYYVLEITTDEWEKTLRNNEIDSILEFSNKILIEHANGTVYELKVKDIIRHIDNKETKEIWEKTFGINNIGVEDEDFDIEQMITNKGE